MAAPDGEEIYISRTAKYQTEKYTKSGKTHKYLISWSGDCEYILTLHSTTSKENEALLGSGLFVKITEVGEDYYSCIILTEDNKTPVYCDITKLR